MTPPRPTPHHGVHTCHAACPCHQGGDPVPDFEESAVPDQSGGHLPEWATYRCDDCDEMFLPGFGTVWSSNRPEVHTHGGRKYCAAQAAYLQRNPNALPIQLSLMQQAIVEAQETLGRLVSECDEENWNEEVSAAVFTAMHSLERGYDAYKIVDFPARITNA